MNRKEMLKQLKDGKDPLEISIAKWQDIVDGKGLDYNCDNCALCEAYRDYSSIASFNRTECDKCPVFKVTKKPCCQGSPWPQTFGNDDLGANKKELDFLISLRAINHKEETKEVK